MRQLAALIILSLLSLLLASIVNSNPLYRLLVVNHAM